MPEVLPQNSTSAVNRNKALGCGIIFMIFLALGTIGVFSLFCLALLIYGCSSKPLSNEEINTRKEWVKEHAVQFMLASLKGEQTKVQNMVDSDFNSTHEVEAWLEKSKKEFTSDRILAAINGKSLEEYLRSICTVKFDYFDDYVLDIDEPIDMYGDDELSPLAIFKENDADLLCIISYGKQKLAKIEPNELRVSSETISHPMKDEAEYNAQKARQLKEEAENKTQNARQLTSQQKRYPNIKSEFVLSQFGEPTKVAKEFFILAMSGNNRKARKLISKNAELGEVILPALDELRKQIKRNGMSIPNESTLREEISDKSSEIYNSVPYFNRYGANTINVFPEGRPKELYALVELEDCYGALFTLVLDDDEKWRILMVEIGL